MPEYQARGVVWEDLKVGDEISTIHWFVTPDDIKWRRSRFTTIIRFISIRILPRNRNGEGS